MWVRSKYTSELAVLAAWVSALLPWNLTHHTDATVGGFQDIETTVFFLRFVFLEIQIRQETVVNNEVGLDVTDVLTEQYAGAGVGSGVYLTSPPTSMLFYEDALFQASLLWTVAAAALALALLLSIALYFRTEATLERLPVSEVRLMGALLGIVTVALAGSSVLYYLERDLMGTPIPIGIPVLGALSLVLLLMKEVEGEAEG